MDDNRIPKSIIDRFGLTRFVQLIKGAVSDELEESAPDSVERAIENPTGVFQQTYRAMNIKLDTITKTGSKIKDDTTLIIQMLKKIEKKNYESDGVGGILAGFGLAGLLGRRRRKIREARERKIRETPDIEEKRKMVPREPEEHEIERLWRRSYEYTNAHAENNNLSNQNDPVEIEPRETPHFRPKVSPKFIRMPKSVLRLGRAGSFIGKMAGVAAIAVQGYQTYQRMIEYENDPKLTAKQKEELEDVVFKEFLLEMSGIPLFTAVGQGIYGATKDAIVNKWNREEERMKYARPDSHSAGLNNGSYAQAMADYNLRNNIEQVILATVTDQSRSDYGSLVQRLDMNPQYSMQDVFYNVVWLTNPDTTKLNKQDILAGAQLSNPFSVPKNMLQSVIEKFRPKKQSSLGYAGMVQKASYRPGEPVSSDMGSDSISINNSPNSNIPSIPGFRGAPGYNPMGTYMMPQYGTGSAGKMRNYTGINKFGSSGNSKNVDQGGTDGRTTTGRTYGHSIGNTQVGGFRNNLTTGKARGDAEKYLGRKMTDTEWTELMQLTSAEAAQNSPKEAAMIAGAILNRARIKGKTVGAIMREPNQFEAYGNGHWQRPITASNQAAIEGGMQTYLLKVDKGLQNFRAKGYEGAFNANHRINVGGSVFDTPNAPDDKRVPLGSNNRKMTKEERYPTHEKKKGGDVEAARAYLYDTAIGNAKSKEKIANMHPDYVLKAAAAIKEARSKGIKTGLFSDFRSPGHTGSAFDASGASQHSYGLGGDYYGLEGDDKAKVAFAQIMKSHGLHGYGPDNRTEYNHFEDLPYHLPSTPKADENNPKGAALRKKLMKTIDANGNPIDREKMWEASGIPIPESSDSKPSLTQDQMSRQARKRAVELKKTAPLILDTSKDELVQEKRKIGPPLRYQDQGSNELTVIDPSLKEVRKQKGIDLDPFASPETHIDPNIHFEELNKRIDHLEKSIESNKKSDTKPVTIGHDDKAQALAKAMQESKSSNGLQSYPPKTPTMDKAKRNAAGLSPSIGDDPAAYFANI